MPQDMTPIIQAFQDLGQVLGETVHSTVIGLWQRDELLFIAVLVILVQACWILHLRFQARRMRRKLDKLMSQVTGTVDSDRPKRDSVYTTFKRKAQSLFPHRTAYPDSR